jgi:hypothetical protein
MESKHTEEKIAKYLSGIKTRKPRILFPILYSKYGVPQAFYSNAKDDDDIIEITHENQQSPSPLETELLNQIIDFVFQ